MDGLGDVAPDVDVGEQQVLAAARRRYPRSTPSSAGRAGSAAPSAALTAWCSLEGEVDRSMPAAASRALERVGHGAVAREVLDLDLPPPLGAGMPVDDGAHAVLDHLHLRVAGGVDELAAMTLGR